MPKLMPSRPTPLLLDLAQDLLARGNIQLLTGARQGLQAEIGGPVDQFTANLTASTAYKDSHLFVAS